MTKKAVMVSLSNHGGQGWRMFAGGIVHRAVGDAWRIDLCPA